MRAASAGIWHSGLMDASGIPCCTLRTYLRLPPFWMLADRSGCVCLEAREQQFLCTPVRVRAGRPN